MNKKNVYKIERMDGKVRLPKNKADQYGYRLIKTYKPYGSIMPFLFFGMSALFLLFVVLFAYFYYERDVATLVGFIAYALTLSLIINFLIIVPAANIVGGFLLIIKGDDFLLNFYGLEETMLTSVLFYVVGAVLIVFGVIQTLLFMNAYMRIHQSGFSRSEYWGQRADSTPDPSIGGIAASNIDIMMVITIIFCLILILVDELSLWGYWILGLAILVAGLVLIGRHVLPYISQRK